MQIKSSMEHRTNWAMYLVGSTLCELMFAFSLKRCGAEWSLSKACCPVCHTEHERERDFIWMDVWSKSVLFFQVLEK